jgi:hypothetical protein
MQKSEIGDDERVSSGSESIWKEMGEDLIPLSNKSENSPRTCLCLLIEIFNSDYSECLEADDVKVPRPFTNCSASVAHKSEFTLERAGQVLWQSVGKWNLVKSCWKRSSLNKDKYNMMDVIHCGNMVGEFHRLDSIDALLFQGYRYGIVIV